MSLNTPKNQQNIVQMVANKQMPTGSQEATEDLTVQEVTAAHGSNQQTLENMGSKHNRKILQMSKKIAVILVFCIQVFRLVCVLLTFFFVFVSLLIYEEALVLLDPPPSQTNSRFLTPELNKPTYATLHKVQDVIGILLPMAEVLYSIFIIYIVIGPLSPRITYGQWFKWLFKLRIFWMRVLWTSTAIAYAILMIKVREMKFKESGNTMYVDNDLVKVGLAFTTLEYGSLGVVESVLKVIKMDTFEKRLQAYESGIVGRWRKLCKLSCYLGTVAFSLRNFSMTIYFAVLSTVDLTVTHQKIFPLTPFERAQLRMLQSAMLVLQVYITLIRGKFCSFFLKIFLSNFLTEEDDQQLQGKLQGMLHVETESKDKQIKLLKRDKSLHHAV